MGYLMDYPILRGPFFENYLWNGDTVLFPQIEPGAIPQMRDSGYDQGASAGEFFELGFGEMLGHNPSDAVRFLLVRNHRYPAQCFALPSLDGYWNGIDRSVRRVDTLDIARRRIVPPVGDLFRGHALG